MSEQVSPHAAEALEVDDGPRAASGFGPAGQTGKPSRTDITASSIALPPELTEPVRRANAFHNHALERTAAFLIVLSRNNGYEGRDPTLIADEMNCGLVADMLGIGIDTLAGVLIDLERRGLVVSGEDGGLRLTDIDALDLLSEGQPSAPTARAFCAAHA